MIAIIGSGFGLYGYLPALTDGCEERVVLPERYRTRLYERTELERFTSNVQWEQNDTKVLDCASGVVLALQPIKQSELIPQCLARPNIKHLLLEKPLAHSPAIALTLFDDLVRSGKVFRIGYNFRYTEWGKQLLNSQSIRSESGMLTIHWSFTAHHFRHNLRNWKRFNSVGGGAIRFYGIHIIALLSEIGYRNVTLSRAYGAFTDEIEKWVAIFEGNNLPECKVVVNAKSKFNTFEIVHTSKKSTESVTNVFAKLSDPFEPQSIFTGKDQIDQRVPILSQLCQSLWEERKNEYELYDAVLNLWLRIEGKTQFEQVSPQKKY